MSFGGPVTTQRQANPLGTPALTFSNRAVNSAQSAAAPAQTFAPAPPRAAPAQGYAPAPARSAAPARGYAPAPARAPAQGYGPAPAPAPTQGYGPAPVPTPTQGYGPAPMPSATPTRPYAPAPARSAMPPQGYTPAPTRSAATPGANPSDAEIEAEKAKFRVLWMKCRSGELNVEQVARATGSKEAFLRYREYADHLYTLLIECKESVNKVLAGAQEIAYLEQHILNLQKQKQQSLNSAAKKISEASESVTIPKRNQK